MADIPLITTAFMAGLLGSGHCLAMCGSIAAGFGATSGQKPLQVFLFNISRITSYAALGCILALIVGQGGRALQLPAWSQYLRLFASLLILVIGLQYLFRINVLSHIERAGGRIWRRLQPGAALSKIENAHARTLLMGLAWGFLPCGLVYTVLLLASASGTAASGFVVMLSFGLGTLPSMIGVSMIPGTILITMNSDAVKRMIGASLVILAVWSVFAAGFPGSEATHHH